jgi:hypothetical protein
MQKVAFWKHRLDDVQLRLHVLSTMGVSGYELPLEETVIPEELNRIESDLDEVQIFREDDLKKLAHTDKPIVRMAKKKYVDAFFNDGTLRLGTLAYYQLMEQAEMGDPREGWYIICARNSKGTLLSVLEGALHSYVLCCTSGYPSNNLLQGFEHDDSFEIVNRAGFARAIGKKIGALNYASSRCIYSRYKVVETELPENFFYDYNSDEVTLSGELLNLFNESQYFIKPLEFKHQKEFRFMWEVKTPVTGPTDCNKVS